MLAFTKLGFCRGTYHDLADGEPDEIHLPAPKDRRHSDKRRWSDAESDGHHHHHNSSDDEWSGSDEDESPDVAATRSLLDARQKQQQPFVREVYTIAQAERYLVDSLDVLFDQEVNEAQTQWMRARVGANCLHKGAEVDRLGNHQEGGGKRWCVAVDGSASAHRAWELMIKMVDPSRDHVMVVTVRDKDLPRLYGRTTAEVLRLRYELWRWASFIIGPYARQLESFMDPSRYTIVVPESLDERNMLCEISRRYAIHTLVVGKHARAEHNNKHWRLRSLSSYVTKNAPVQKVLVL